MKTQYNINLVRVGRTIQGDVLIEESALNEVVKYVIEFSTFGGNKRLNSTSKLHGQNVSFHLSVAVRNQSNNETCIRIEMTKLRLFDIVSIGVRNFVIQKYPFKLKLVFDCLLIACKI